MKSEAASEADRSWEKEEERAGDGGGALPPSATGRFGEGVNIHGFHWDSPPTPTRIASRSDLPLAGGGELTCAGAALVADVAGALYWPEQRMLVVSDLHLEKGSSFALRGSLLPPYDTADTLIRLARLVERYAPRAVLSLGDNFHDRVGAGRLSPADRQTLRELQRGRDWIWIAGNHDPDPQDGIGGEFVEILAAGSLAFRHKPGEGAAAGEISGHLHPVAVVAMRGRGVRRRCFIGDGARLVMPAFGAYAGGLNVRHRVFAGLFGKRFTAHVLGDERLYAIAPSRCVPDWGWA